MMHHPIHQRLLETDIRAGLFRFQLLEPQYLITLGKELLIKQGTREQTVVGRTRSGLAARLYSPHRKQREFSQP